MKKQNKKLSKTLMDATNEDLVIQIKTLQAKLAEAAQVHRQQLAAAQQAADQARDNAATKIAAAEQEAEQARLDAAAAQATGYVI